MKHTTKFAVALAIFATIYAAHADPTRSITITIEYPNNTKEYFTASSFTDSQALFPIKINNRIYSCSSDLNEKENKVFLDIRDPSVIIPGGGTSAGCTLPILLGMYPVPTGDLLVYKSQEYSIHLTYTNKEKTAEQDAAANP